MSVKYPGEKGCLHLTQRFSPRHAASAAASVALPLADQSCVPLTPPAQLHQAQGIISKYLHQLQKLYARRAQHNRCLLSRRKITPWETLVNKTTFLTTSNAVPSVPMVGSASCGQMHPCLVSGKARCPALPCCPPACLQGSKGVAGQEGVSQVT